jgi:Nucleosome assembly protein (NAP)
MNLCMKETKKKQKSKAGKNKGQVRTVTQQEPKQSFFQYFSEPIEVTQRWLHSTIRTSSYAHNAVENQSSLILMNEYCSITSTIFRHRALLWHCPMYCDC